MTKDQVRSTEEALDLALEALEHMLEDAKQERLTVEYWNECVDAITAIKQARSAQVAWKWHQAPVKTSWGDDMVVADLAIDKDNTVSVYCERDQTTKVVAMFTPPTAQPAPVQEVSWGVDWGKAGDIPCVSIIKRLPEGGIQVVAVEYAPYSYTTRPAAQRQSARSAWVGLSDEDLANCSGHEVRWALYWDKLLKERNT